MRNPLRHILRLPRNAILLLIRGYQRTLSPDHGPLRVLWPHGYCPQHPTCSEYAAQIVAERGAVVGSALAAWRVLTCHPGRKPTDEKLAHLASSQRH